MRLIDADSLKERMIAETPEHEKGVVDIFLEAVATMIDEQPTIEERKTGKWIKRALGWKCSNCNLCTNDRGADDFNFCPNCGADMRGDDHETN